MTTLYYEYKEPEPPLKSQGWDLVGLDYRGFILKIDGLYLLWTVQMKDGSLPPVELHGNYTTQNLAKEAVDKFLSEERKKQQAFEEAEKSKECSIP